MAGNIKIKKINNRTEPNPIQQIADGATANQCEANCIPMALFLDPFMDKKNCRQGNNGNTNKKNLAQPARMPCQNAKCRPCIGQIGKVEKSGDNSQGFIQNKMMYHPCLGQLIKHNNQEKTDCKKHG